MEPSCHKRGKNQQNNTLDGNTLQKEDVQGKDYRKSASLNKDRKKKKKKGK